MPERPGHERDRGPQPSVCRYGCTVIDGAWTTPDGVVCSNDRACGAIITTTELRDPVARQAYQLGWDDGYAAAAWDLRE